MKLLFGNLLTLLLIYSSIQHAHSDCVIKNRFSISGRRPALRNYVIFRYVRCENLTSTDITKTSLATIDQYGMNIQTFEVFNSDFSSLQTGFLNDFTDLRKLILKGCHIEDIEVEAFLHLSLLEELYLGNNSLRSLPVNVFSPVDHLLILDLSYNQFSTLDNLVFEGLTNLQKLLLNGNQLQTLPDDVFEYLKSLEYLDLSFNKLTSLNASLSKLYQLETLILSNNNFAQFSAIQTLPPKLTTLTYLDLSCNDLGEIDGSQLFNTLQSLNVSNNRITFLKDMFDLSDLLVLDISANKLGNPPNNLIRNMTKLVSLHMQSMDLEFIPDDFFSNNHKIEFLNLSYNQLNVLDDGVFKGLISLRSLDLSHNLIPVLPEDTFSNAKELEVLDISYNKLKSYNFHALLQNCQELRSLNLIGNNFHCSVLDGLAQEAAQLGKPKKFLIGSDPQGNLNIPCNNSDITTRSLDNNNSVVNMFKHEGEDFKEIYNFFDTKLENTSLFKLYSEYKNAASDTDLKHTSLFDIIMSKEQEKNQFKNIHAKVDNVHGLLVGLYVFFALMLISAVSFFGYLYVKRRRSPGSTSEYLL